MVKTSSGRLWVGSCYDVFKLYKKPERHIFDLIWNLADELTYLVDDESKYSKEVLWAEIKDFSIPSGIKFDTQLHTVLKTLKKNGKVFIHCMGGHGRTGMVLAVIKKLLDGMSAREALFVANKYCNGPETDEQFKFVIDI